MQPPGDNGGGDRMAMVQRGRMEPLGRVLLRVLLRRDRIVVLRRRSRVSWLRIDFRNEVDVHRVSLGTGVGVRRFAIAAMLVAVGLVGRWRGDRMLLLRRQLRRRRLLRYRLLLRLWPPLSPRVG